VLNRRADFSLCASPSELTNFYFVQRIFSAPLLKIEQSEKLDYEVITQAREDNNYTRDVNIVVVRIGSLNEEFQIFGNFNETSLTTIYWWRNIFF
jgi:hypothetical protein